MLFQIEIPFAEGKPIPHDLRHDEAQLRREVELEDDNTAVTRNHIDDEYAHAGEADPKVLITTSREPSSRLTQFAKVGWREACMQACTNVCTTAP